MTTHFVLTPKAQADLEEIWDYTAERWGLEQAELYIRQLWRDIVVLGTRPTLGKQCLDLRPGYRKHLSGSHVLFYRPTLDGIDIVRILHERMDPERHIL